MRRLPLALPNRTVLNVAGKHDEEEERDCDGFFQTMAKQMAAQLPAPCRRWRPKTSPGGTKIALRESPGKCGRRPSERTGSKLKVPMIRLIRSSRSPRPRG